MYQEAAMSHKASGSSLPSHTDNYRSLMRQYRLLLILPLLLGVVLFFCVQIVTTRQIQQAGDMAAQRFHAQSHGILHEIELVSDSLLSDGMFRQDMYSAGGDEFDPMELCNTIRSHIRQSEYVSDVYVISQKQGFIYSDNSYFLYPGRPGTLLEIFPDSYDIRLDTDSGWHILNANYTPPYYITRLSDVDGNTAATLIVTLNMREFLHTLYVENTALCCIFNDEFSVSSLLTNHPGLNWRSSEAVSQVLGVRVRCFYIESEGFTYLTAISTKSYYAPLWTIVGVFCAYFLVILVVGVIYLRVVSRRRYRNMAALIDGLPQATGTNPTYEEMLTTIRASLADYRLRDKAAREQSLLHRLLFGSYAAAIPSAELTYAGFPEGTEGYYAVLFHLRDSSGIVDGSAPAINADMTCMILDAGLNRFVVDGLYAAVAQIDRDYCAVLSLTTGEITPQDIKTAVRDTVQLIEQEYGFDLCAAVSSRVNTPEELRGAYQEAYSLFGFHRAVGSDADVLMQEDVLTDSSALLNGDFMKQLQVLTNTLLLEKYDYIPSMVSTLLEDHVAASPSHYAHAQNRLSTIASLLADAVLSSSFPEDFRAAAAEKLRTADSISGLNAAVEDVFGYMGRNTQAAASESTVQKAFDYINENLSDPSLSVPAVCEAVGVTVQHLLRLFRQRLDMTLVEYINTCRIERSKPLLLEKNSTVASVAEAVGYNNTVTFTRNFRRYVGMAPSEYRELNR